MVLKTFVSLAALQRTARFNKVYHFAKAGPALIALIIMNVRVPVQNAPLIFVHYVDLLLIVQFHHSTFAVLTALVLLVNKTLNVPHLISPFVLKEIVSHVVEIRIAAHNYHSQYALEEFVQLDVAHQVHVLAHLLQNAQEEYADLVLVILTAQHLRVSHIAIQPREHAYLASIIKNALQPQARNVEAQTHVAHVQ